jgi:hypothetical protein
MGWLLDIRHLMGEHPQCYRERVAKNACFVTIGMQGN